MRGISLLRLLGPECILKAFKRRSIYDPATNHDC
jgi:hypothetical protein